MSDARSRSQRILIACRTILGKSADRLLDWQRNFVGALVVITVCLILLNVVTRALNVALFWVDELAIDAMVWAFMLGAAATVRPRQGIAIALVRDYRSCRLSSWDRGGGNRDFVRIGPGETAVLGEIEGAG